jgi:hypothetical protein
MQQIGVDDELFILIDMYTENTLSLAAHKQDNTLGGVRTKH